MYLCCIASIDIEDILWLRISHHNNYKFQFNCWFYFSAHPTVVRGKYCFQPKKNWHRMTFFSHFVSPRVQKTWIWEMSMYVCHPSYIMRFLCIRSISFERPDLVQNFVKTLHMRVAQGRQGFASLALVSEKNDLVVLGRFVA